MAEGAGHGPQDRHRTTAPQKNESFLLEYFQERLPEIIPSE